jgi:high-affinity iron transporter
MHVLEIHMLASLLLVFREVLEAALIISVVAAATRSLPGRERWIVSGIVLGVLGALLVALFANQIAAAMSGMGQEWFNAGVLLAAVVMIGWHVVWMARHGRELAMQMKLVGNDVTSGNRPMTALLFVIALAVLREGSEVVLFGYGLLVGGSDLGPMIGGGVLGLLCGIGLGYAMYAGLLKIPMRHFFTATNGLMVLLAAGLAASAAGYLVQADVLPALLDPVWDTSSLLSDESFFGKTLHILIGYSATPTGMQLVFYSATALAMLIGMRLFRLPDSKKIKLNSEVTA